MEGWSPTPPSDVEPTPTGSSRLHVPEPSLGCAAGGTRRSSIGRTGAPSGCGNVRLRCRHRRRGVRALHGRQRLDPGRVPGLPPLPVVLRSGRVAWRCRATRRRHAEVSQHLKLGWTLAGVIADAGGEAGEGRVVLLVSGLFALAFTPGGCSAGCSTSRPRCGSCGPDASPARPDRSCVCSGACLFGFVLYSPPLVRNAGFVAGLAGASAPWPARSWPSSAWGGSCPDAAGSGSGSCPGAALWRARAVGAATARHLLPGPAHRRRLRDLRGHRASPSPRSSYLFLVGVIVVCRSPRTPSSGSASRTIHPALFRRIADRIPIPASTLGLGYVAEGDDGEVLGPLGPMAGPNAPER